MELMALDLLKFLTDMYFVIQIMTLSYLLYWLYLTFRDVPVLFAISSLVGFFFIWISPLGVTALMILFFGLIFFGNQMQMILLFGIGPLYSILTGKRMMQPGETTAMLEAEEMQSIEQKIMKGQEISSVEQGKYAKMMQKQMNLEAGRQQLSQQMDTRQRMRPMG